MNDLRRDWKLTTNGTIVLLYEREEFWIRIMHKDAGKQVYLVPKIPIDTVSLLRFLRPRRQEFESRGLRVVLEDHIRMLTYVNGSLIGWGGRTGFSTEVKMLLEDVGVEIKLLSSED